MKIGPTNKFIKDMVALHGEVIMVLGTRKAESSNRQQTLEHYEKLRSREHLNPSSTSLNTFIYPLLENWSNDNVWQYLMMEKNPWGNSNNDLLTMYRGATADGECPLVLDTDTPSCGNSRFGCWVCTLVSKDKSMAAMILNDTEKAWMLPLLEFRNKIGDMEKEMERRDFRRMGGSLKLHWAAFMETVLPAGISKFFFFDGEKIMELANDQTDEELKSAIKSLLGIDTVDRLIDDLGREVLPVELDQVKALVDRRSQLEKKNGALEQYINRADHEMEVQEVYEKLRVYVEKAREQVAHLLGIKPYEVYFTSGSTESNNLAMPNTLNVSFEGVNSEALMLAMKGICSFSNGSACTAKDYAYSYVLDAMGLPGPRLESAVRLSWDLEDISEGVRDLIQVVGMLQGK